MRILIKFGFILLTLCTLFSFTTQAQSSTEQDSGWVKIYTNIPEFYLIIDDDFRNATIQHPEDSIKLTIGHHKIRLAGNNVPDKQYNVRIFANKTTTKNIVFTFRNRNPDTSYPILVNRLNFSINTDPGSVIYIDGQEVGVGGATLFLNPGYHTFKAIHPEFGALTKKIKVDYTSFGTISRYNQNPYPNRQYMRFVPGLGYLLNGQYGKAGITYAALIALSYYGISVQNEYNEKEKLYQEKFFNYESSTNYIDALRFRRETLEIQDEMEMLNQKITYTAIGISSLYLITTIDGFLKPRQGYKKESDNRPMVNFTAFSYSGKFYPSLSLTKRF